MGHRVTIFPGSAPHGTRLENDASFVARSVRILTIGADFLALESEADQ